MAIDEPSCEMENKGCRRAFSRGSALMEFKGSLALLFSARDVEPRLDQSWGG